LPGELFSNQENVEKEQLCPVSSRHAFHIMPAILITYKRRFIITQNLPSTNIHRQNCRNCSTAIRNISYFIHTSLVYNTMCYWNRQMSFGWCSANIACDWLLRRTPHLAAVVYTYTLYLGEKLIQPVKPGREKQHNFF